MPPKENTAVQRALIPKEKVVYAMPTINDTARGKLLGLNVMPAITIELVSYFRKCMNAHQQGLSNSVSQGPKQRRGKKTANCVRRTKCVGLESAWDERRLISSLLKKFLRYRGDSALSNRPLLRFVCFTIFVHQRYNLSSFFHVFILVVCRPDRFFLS